MLRGGNSWSLQYILVRFVISIYLLDVCRWRTLIGGDICGGRNHHHLLLLWLSKDNAAELPPLLPLLEK